MTIFDPAEFLTDRQLGRLHSASLEILRGTGLAFGCPEVVDICKANGLKTSGQTVYFTDRVIEKSLEMVPNEFTLAARNPKQDLALSPSAQAFGPGSGAALLVDRRGGFSLAGGDDFIRAAKLGQTLPQMKFCRPLLMPHDIPPEKVLAWMMVQQIIHQDKPYYLMHAGDVPILARTFGLSEKEMREAALLGRCHGLSTVNVTSPLYVAEEACRDLLGFCRAGVAFNVTSMPSAGGTAPCSLTSTLLVQNCENLGVLTLAQLVSPGHPVLYGAMGGHSDMRTLSHVYGGPENRLLELGGGRLARYYGLLVRGGTVTTDAPAVDYQAGAESMFQLFSAALAGLNFLPGCGHLGSYLAGSLEKMVLDAENIDYIDRLRRPLKFGDDDLALDVIREIGPKGNFVNHPQTFKRFRGEFLLPEVFNRSPFEQWRKAGSPSALELAGARVEALINEYRKPDLAPDLEKSLLEFC